MTMASLAREKATAQREQKAIERELKETVRADTVARFIGTVLETGKKSMISQGNIAGAKDLIRQTDELASTSLSKFPAAELTIHEILKGLLADGLTDSQGAYDQSKKVMELLPQVSDDQLHRPSDTLCLNYAARGLWAAGSEEEKEEKHKELKSLREEFLGRGPCHECLPNGGHVAC